MRVLLQRVLEASVSVLDENKRLEKVSEIQQGLLVLLGIEEADTQEDAKWLAQKICGLRIFEDENGQMNKSIQDIDGQILLVSQFTLFAATKKGKRPSFIRAARPEQAIPLYEYFHELVKTEMGSEVPTGRFGAEMKVGLVNDGPVTIWIDSRNRE